MVLTLGSDRAGRWAAVECDYRGCYSHVTERPGLVIASYDLVCAAFDRAIAEGWRLNGTATCTRHRWDRPGRRLRVADGFPWLTVER